MIRGHLCVGRAHERTWVIAQQMMDETDGHQQVVAVEKKNWVRVGDTVKLDACTIGGGDTQTLADEARPIWVPDPLLTVPPMVIVEVRGGQVMNILSTYQEVSVQVVLLDYDHMIESGEKPNTFFPVDTIVSQDVIDSLGDVKD
jgi:hypothetical protein